MSSPTIQVLNPKGNDPFQDFSTRKNIADPSGHAPINYHAYAAATGGCFAQNTDEILGKEGVVLILLRKRLGKSIRALQKLKKHDVTVWIAWKESGTHQIASAMKRLGNKQKLTKCLALADAVVCPSSAAVHFFRKFGTGKTPLLDLPTPYPIDHSAWALKPDRDTQVGIMIGTREFDVPSRNHSTAIAIAAEVAKATKTPLTVINNNAKPGLKSIKNAVGELDDSLLSVVSGPLPYRKYLELIASHRVVFQLDTSRVPGQVAGDCLLADTTCIGGNGEIEQRAFPATCITGDDINEHDWNALLTQTLTDADHREKARRKTRDIASGSLSFSAFRSQLKKILD